MVNKESRSIQEQIDLLKSSSEGLWIIFKSFVFMILLFISVV